MATREIPIKIQDDPYTRQEQFRDLAPDIEIGNQGTIRLQNFSFQDGEAVYLNVGGTEVRRDAGFQKPLTLQNANQETRTYYFRCSQWYQETTTPNSSLTALQQKVGQLGFWFGLYEWLLDVGEVAASVANWLLAPLTVIPALLLQSIHYLYGLFCTVVFCIVIWGILLDVIGSLLFGLIKTVVR